MNAIAVILGRAGSKGVPGKNITPVAGKPCARWTIEAAKSSARVGTIIVSSDDPRLLDLGASEGAVAVRRPPDLATDAARIDDAARHAIETFEAAERPLSPAEPIVILYANVPVRPADLIGRAVELLTESGCDSVQSYAAVGKFHPWWIARIDPSGRVAPWEGDVLNHGVFRRQDLPPAFVPDGGVIALTRRALFCQIPGVAPGPHAFFGADRRGVINPEGAVVDIDSPADLLAADAVLRDRNAHR
ncbi:MAG: acylneuraminate cytidylyltransferase family protein [Phycisphaerales bacterium]|nr:acylneuraminate cytidylyltransferase family protein [Planctomycetota bacterium]